MLSLCVRLNRPSVRLSHAGIASKRQNVESRKQRRTITKRLKFYDAKNLREIPTGSLQRGRQIEMGVNSNGDFWPISRYISETVQDRDIVTVER